MSRPKSQRGAQGPDAFPEEEAPQRPLQWSLISRTFAYTLPYARQRNLLFVLVLTRAIQLPLINWALAKVIAGPIARHDWEGTLWGAVGFFGLVVFAETVFVYRMALALSLGEKLAFDMRKDLQGQLRVMPMSFFHRVPLGRLISRLTSDVDVVRLGVQDVVFVSTVQAGSMVLAAALMLYYDWLLFLIVLLMVPIVWWLVRRFTARLAQAHRNVQETFSRLTSSLAESVNGIRVIQGYSRQEKNDDRFASLISVHADNNMRAAEQGAVLVPALEFNGQLFLAIVVVIGGYQAVVGAADFEALVQFLFLSSLLFGPIPVLGRLYDQALSAMAGAERVFAMLDRKPDWQDDANATPLDRLTGAVAFEKVSFGYEHDRLVLEDITFSVSPGQRVALVGHTGSGKTTITRLLAKLYLPTSGSVRIDGRDLAHISSDSLHRFLGCVPQDNYLFSGSVRENVRYAKPGATDEEIVAVLRTMGIASLLDELPQGLDTEVGEKGASLSLGQRQLVCFARALLPDPKLLVLDEATSSVDAVTEHRLQAALGILLEGRTSFVVAHRLSTILGADLILVIDHGRLVEQGTHRELLARGGVYTRLFLDYAGASVVGRAP
jgi:ATP-binding cassette, subfamily B, bacterial